MRYSFYFSLLFTLGFLLISADTYACGKKSATVENSCCKEKATSDRKSCCEKASAKDKSNNHSCDGSCKDLSCQNFSASSGVLAPSFSLLTFQDHLSKREKFFDTSTPVAVGFLSLLFRPKIG